jgi:hypothetical protein
MIKRFTVAAVSAVISVFFLTSAAHADRGMMTISADPDIVLSEGVQRAVIAFNGSEEILVLATEVSASVPGKILEFLPLPSAPTIEAASPDLFDRALFLIRRHAPTTPGERGGRNGGELTAQPPGIEVVSRTTIGPHDVTVVKIESADHFVGWISAFFEKEGITAGPAKALAMKTLVETYLDRGLPYFAFDVVTASADSTGIAPLSYRFASDSLYYPLEISSTTSGASEIDLFLVTPGTPRKSALPKGFAIADYVFPAGPLGEGKERPSGPISVPLGMTDRVILSPEMAALLPGWNTGVRLTVVRYRGPLKSLSGDFVLRKKDFSDADFDAVDRAIDNRKGLSGYAPPGTVDLAAPSADRAAAVTTSADGSFIYYVSTGPFFSSGRVEFPASYSAPAAADGDPSTPFILQQDRSWSIDLAQSRQINAVDILAAVPIPDRDTTYTYGIRLLASDTGKFEGEQKMVGSGVIESYTTTGDGDDVAGHASLIRLAGKPFKARYLKIEYIPYGAYNDMLLFEVMPWGKTQ